MQRQVLEAHSLTQGRERPLLERAFREPKPQPRPFDPSLPPQVLEIRDHPNLKRFEILEASQRNQSSLNCGTTSPLLYLSEPSMQEGFERLSTLLGDEKL